MELKTGARLRSATDATEVVVVKAPGTDVDLRCGGHPMAAADAARGDDLPVRPGYEEGCQIGKRYTDEDAAVEVLCTKAGGSALSIGDVVLQLKGAKPLPSSD